MSRCGDGNRAELPAVGGATDGWGAAGDGGARRRGKGDRWDDGGGGGERQ